MTDLRVLNSFLYIKNVLQKSTKSKIFKTMKADKYYSPANIITITMLYAVLLYGNSSVFSLHNLIKKSTIVVCCLLHHPFMTNGKLQL